MRRLWTVVVAALVGALLVPTAAHAAAIPSYLTMEQRYTSVANRSSDEPDSVLDA